MAALGSLSNFSTLICLTHCIIKEGKSCIPEVILAHISGSNLLVFLTRVLPSSLSAFGFRDLYTDVGCKINILIFRTCRGAVIGLTCLLSCYQGITLSATSSKWMRVKARLRAYMPIIVYICYLVNMASNLDVVYYAVSLDNRSIVPYTYNLRYCLVIYPNKVIFEAMGLQIFIQDLVPVLAMAAANAYILLVLYRHKKVLRGLVQSDRQRGKTAESQATKTVVILVTLYVTFYGIDNAMWLYQTVSNETLALVTDVRIFFTMCYGFVFPVVTVAFNPKLRNTMKVLRREREQTPQNHDMGTSSCAKTL
ncbi:olfactory receptor class A-like protein 1 [Ambystoma mexicanum]|uniref:olfactory receptor class A-like protein 1 n=1 Tax=Ambystoma mexicanum TaxID=8296 RepID=UPI0037E955B2